MTDISELSRKLAALEAEVVRLRALVGDDRPASAETSAPVTGGRRSVLKLAGAAAVGVAAGVAGSRPAMASTGDGLILGHTNFANKTTHILQGEGGSIPTNFSSSLLLIEALSSAGMDSYSASSFAIVARSANSTGLFAHSYSGLGIEAMSQGSTGVRSSGAGYAFESAGGGRADLRLSPTLSGIPKQPPMSRSDAHERGELDMDIEGNLWFCVEAGSPGTWRKVSGASTGGSFHPFTPFRVYDSREPQPAPGVLSSGQNRTISVAHARSVNGGGVTFADRVPVGARAVATNVTIVSVSGSGFLTINPGGSTTVNSSVINWSAGGQVLANGVPLVLNPNRQLTVIAGGAGSTHFIVDVLGWWQ